MPNYVANVVTFGCDEKKIKDMLLAVQNDKFGTGSISFNKIIPMPPELDMESSNRSKAGLRAYQDFVAAYSLGRDFSKEDLLHIPGKAEDAYLRRHSGIDRERLADNIVDMALAHSAHHSINFQCNFQHSYRTFLI